MIVHRLDIIIFPMAAFFELRNNVSGSLLWTVCVSTINRKPLIEMT